MGRSRQTAARAAVGFALLIGVAACSTDVVGSAATRAAVPSPTSSAAPTPPLTMTVTATSTSTVAAPATEESSTEQPPTRPAPVNRVIRSSSLVTPSGNIRCLLLDNGSELHCAIGQHDFPIKRCQGQPGVTVLLNTVGAPHLSECADESFIGALLQPVGYDTTVELGDFRCDVSQSGVRCANPAGHGFHLARAGYEPF